MRVAQLVVSFEFPRRAQPLRVVRCAVVGDHSRCVAAPLGFPLVEHTFCSLFVNYSTLAWGPMGPKKKNRVRHSHKISCAPLPTNIVCATFKNIVCATPKQYRVRHSKKYRVRHSPKKSEDQSGGARTNLEVFGDEVSLQYFQKT